MRGEEKAFFAERMNTRNETPSERRQGTENIAYGEDGVAEGRFGATKGGIRADKWRGSGLWRG